MVTPYSTVLGGRRAFVRRDGGATASAPSNPHPRGFGLRIIMHVQEDPDVGQRIQLELFGDEPARACVEGQWMRLKLSPGL